MRGSELDQYQVTPEGSTPPPRNEWWRKLPFVRQIAELFSGSSAPRQKDSGERYAEWDDKSQG